MTEVKKFTSFDEAKQAGIKYMLAVGRRQPAHIGHEATLRKIMDEGMVLICGVGSTNKAEKANGHSDKSFNPISNPLTFEQQREQIIRMFPDKVEGKDFVIVEIPDLGDNPAWCKKVVDSTKGAIEINGSYPDISNEVAWHFIGKPEDRTHVVTKDSEGNEVLGYYWEQTFREVGFPVLSDQPHEGVGLDLSSRQLRTLDLNNLTDAQKAKFANWEYIRDLANKARENNPDGTLNNFPRIPVTMFDLTLQRLFEEKGIHFHQVYEKATDYVDGTPVREHLTVEHLIKAANELNQSPKLIETKRAKVALVGFNQTVYDFSTNFPNIIQGIDYAVAEGADILATQELGLTGYAADDYHMWNKDNEEVWRHLSDLAEDANAQDPNLVISIGAPWHYSDKTLHASDPEYNINNKPYNCQFTITGGKVVAVSAKAILADGPGEYEPRQFRAWPFEKGTIEIKLPDGSTVPFGKPVVGLKKDGKMITITHEQCAEGWPGIVDANKVNLKEFEQARYISQLSKAQDLSLVINPSASKSEPALGKDNIRMKLATEGSKVCGAYIYVNCVGSDSGIHVFDGTQFTAQDGKIIQRGERYSFKDVVTSTVTMDLPIAEKGKPHVIIDHDFKNKEIVIKGEQSPFENLPPVELRSEEYTRAIALWQRDYLQKQPWSPKGYLISLSGGQDSTYAAITTSLAVDLTVKEEGLDKFFERFPQLTFKDEAKEIAERDGIDEALRFIKGKMFHYIYMPTENSGDITRNAAKTLIEGGTLPDGTQVKGIGGTFTIHSIQKPFEEYLITHSGLDMNAVVKDAMKEEKHQATIAQLKETAKGNPQLGNIVYDYVAAEVRREIMEYVNAPTNSNPKLPDYIDRHCIEEIPTWANPKDDNTMQNYQARVRLVTAWAIANKEGKIALVSSNASEAALGYTTAGGDMHMGGANPIGGVPKASITEALNYIYNKGLQGLEAVKALYYVIIQKPTAELRRKEDGKEEQTDEKDMGLSYSQSRYLENAIITNRQTNREVFKQIIESKDTLFSSDPVEVRATMVRFSIQRWEAAQFKRYMATIAPHMGTNMDPHGSVRTTILGDHFNTDVAYLTLDVAAQKLGGADKFKEEVGISLDRAKSTASRDKQVKRMLTREQFPTVEKLKEALRGKDSWLDKVRASRTKQQEGLALAS